MAGSNKATDASNERAYFTVTPRLVWVICRNVYEYTLWGIIRDIAGEGGECYVSTEELAILAMQSVGKVSQCRKFLIKAGLLAGEIRRDPGFPQPVWHLYIPDRWVLNSLVAQELIALKNRVLFKVAQRDGQFRGLSVDNILQQIRGFLASTESLHVVKASPHEGKPSRGEKGPSPREAKKKRKKIQKEEEMSADAAEGENDMGTDQRLARLREKYGKDYLPVAASCAMAQEAVGCLAGFTVPAAAGGADPFAYAPIDAFCALCGTVPDLLTERERKQWAAELRQLAEARSIDAAEMARCISLLPDSDWHWRVDSFTSPYAGGFGEVIAALIRRVQAGQPVRTTNGKDRGGNGHRHSGSRRGYEPCSEQERNAAWRSFGSWMEQYVAEEIVALQKQVGSKMTVTAESVNLDTHHGQISKLLDITQRQAQALCEAFSCKQAMETSPVDIEEILGNEA